MLYAGADTPHRSCGIALAEAFGRPTSAYQALRRGGLTGQGTCGAVVAGQLLLGEFLGDPDPTGAPTAALLDAIQRYDAAVAERLGVGETPDLRCAHLTAPLGDFRGPARHAHCTALVASVAEQVERQLHEAGISVEATPTTLNSGAVFDPRTDDLPSASGAVVRADATTRAGSGTAEPNSDQ